MFLDTVYLSRLCHSLDWYTRVYITAECRLWYNVLISWPSCYGQQVRTNSRDKLLTLGYASVEWVMGRYFTPDIVLRDTRRKWVMKCINLCDFCLFREHAHHATRGSKCWRRHWQYAT